VTDNRRILLEPGWMNALGSEFDQPYMVQLRAFLQQEKAAGKTIYPRGSEIFNALNTTPLDAVRVVILGQDPYHGPGQAHGLCFSVRPGVDPPPSLQNIFKEIQADLGIAPPGHGYLKEWAEQGVLLLNSVLTVVEGQAGAHRNKGWERFTDRVMATLNDHCTGLVFLLWGSYAQEKGGLLDRKRHLVLTAPHPSPLSAHRGFLGCRHFSKANAYLRTQGRAPIDWQLNPLPTTGEHGGS
jgi:uracil-DNA glycosylase